MPFRKKISRPAAIFNAKTVQKEQGHPVFFRKRIHKRPSFEGRALRVYVSQFFMRREYDKIAYKSIYISLYVNIATHKLSWEEVDLFCAKEAKNIADFAGRNSRTDHNFTDSNGKNEAELAMSFFLISHHGLKTGGSIDLQRID